MAMDARAHDPALGVGPFDASRPGRRGSGATPSLGPDQRRARPRPTEWTHRGAGMFADPAVEGGA